VGAAFLAALAGAFFALAMMKSEREREEEGAAATEPGKAEIKESQFPFNIELRSLSHSRGLHHFMFQVYSHTYTLRSNFFFCFLHIPCLQTSGLTLK
jgi:hypothetical protein